MLRDAVAHVLGTPPVHLFVLWSAARDQEDAIVHDVEDRFEVLDRAEIAWSSGPRFASNLSRFYGSDLPPGSEKERHCGTGPFLLLVVRDHHPRYRPRRTSHGRRFLNASVTDARSSYRQLTGGGHKVHASDCVSETRRHLALLLGIPLGEVRRSSSPPGSPVRHLDADLVGAHGWESMAQLVLVLRTHGGRVMRRGQGRITVHAADVWEVGLVAGGVETRRGHRAVQVADDVVDVALREHLSVRVLHAVAGLRGRTSPG